MQRRNRLLQYKEEFLIGSKRYGSSFFKNNELHLKQRALLHT